jgi:NADH dehydrogenase [ubiquinone] 1 alpha subcomplex assembly factor 1
MKHILVSLLIILLSDTKLKNIYTFSTSENLKEWRIVNDGVMGGVSTSSLIQTQNGHGLFSGKVSLANNGGFASIQLNKSVGLSNHHKWIVLRIKGDGKRYEFRLKNKISQNESYVQVFETKGNWETIRLELNEFYPQFRGRRLNMANFNFENIEQLSFLIANKKEENFELLIDSIGVE